MICIFLGGPGAGKGTQSLRVAEKLGIPHISTGDIFREHIRNKTDLGILAEGYISKGQLVPDEVTMSLIEVRIHADDCKKGFILDGFPRTINQAELFDKLLAKEYKKVDKVINLDVADETIVNRLANRRVCPKCGAAYHTKYLQPKKEGICDLCGAELIQRDDDREEVILKRLSAYHTQTEPLIKYYKEAGTIVDVDGSRVVKIIFDDIMEVIEK